jgi:hypothetical protein
LFDNIFINDKMDEDEEERQLMEQLKHVRARKAEKEALKEIIGLRKERIDQLSVKILELKQKITELTFQKAELTEKLESIHRGEEDELLMKDIVHKATQLVITKSENQDKRERTIIHRPPLAGLIKNPTHFKFSCKGRNHRCSTENGTTFVSPNGIVFDTLSAWTTSVLKECDSGGRHVSVFEVCYIWIDKQRTYLKWGDVYTSDCVSINS